MTIDLNAIRERHDAYVNSHDHEGAFACCTAHASGDDVPALIAEVRRLLAVVASVTALTKDTDGNDLDPDSDLPVGVFMQALHEAEEATR